LASFPSHFTRIGAATKDKYHPFLVAKYENINLKSLWQKWQASGDEEKTGQAYGLLHKRPAAEKTGAAGLRPPSKSVL
jgi:hypothetical protein